MLRLGLTVRKQQRERVPLRSGCTQWMLASFNSEGSHGGGSSSIYTEATEAAAAIRDQARPSVARFGGHALRYAATLPSAWRYSSIGAAAAASSRLPEAPCCSALSVPLLRACAFLSVVHATRSLCPTSLAPAIIFACCVLRSGLKGGQPPLASPCPQAAP